MRIDPKTDRVAIILDPQRWRRVEAMPMRRDRAGDVHIVPSFHGERGHVTSINCWCVPSRQVGDLEIVVHYRRAEA